MKSAFILGAGFSKAVNAAMPTVRELSEIARDKSRLEPELESDRLRTFVESGDFELLLSYLAQSAPWKEQAESYTHKALFHKIADRIVAEIVQKESGIRYHDDIPEWLPKLIEYFHRERSSVITFNYDTIIERVARYTRPHRTAEGKTQWIESRWLYPKIMRDVHRLADTGALILRDVPIEVPTFQLTKLHGSINWFYSGEFQFPGEQVFYIPVWKDDPKTDIEMMKEYLRDKKPLIIPPVADKSTFYSVSLIRTLWQDAERALREAECIYFLGYSLPDSDITTRQLLTSTVRRGTKVFIVNRAKTEDQRVDLLRRYKAALPQLTETDFDLTYLAEDAIKHLAEKLYDGLPAIV